MAVGRRVMDYLCDVSKDDRLKGGFKRVFMSQENGVLNNIKLDMGLTVDVAVVPHPSGRSRFFVNPTPEERGKDG